jgi:hypothetical protein
MSGRLRGFTRCRWVGEEDTILARELLEGNWYKASDAAYDEDLVVLVQQPATPFRHYDHALPRWCSRMLKASHKRRV